MDLFLNKRKNKNGWIKIIAGIMVLLLFVVILNLASAGIRNFFYNVTLPLQKSFDSSGKNTASLLGAVFNYKGINQENENLKEENQRLLAQMSQYQDQSEQNQAVKDILACSQSQNFKLVLADVTGLDSVSDFITINKGKDDGVSENMAVVSQQKVLYGKVFKTYKNFSQVMLISNKNSVVDVKIESILDTTTKSDKTPVLGAVKGKGSGSVFLDLVPTDSEISSGESIFTSGLEGVFPKDLSVGKIKSKDKSDLKPFQTALVQPFFDPKRIEKLFVITDYMKIK